MGVAWPIQSFLEGHASRPILADMPVARFPPLTRDANRSELAIAITVPTFFTFLALTPVSKQVDEHLRDRVPCQPRLAPIRVAPRIRTTH